MANKNLEKMKKELDKLINEYLREDGFPRSVGFSDFMKKESRFDVVAINKSKGTLTILIEYMSFEDKNEVDAQARTVVKHMKEITGEEISYKLEKDYFGADDPHSDESSYTIVIKTVIEDPNMKRVGKYADLLR